MTAAGSTPLRSDVLVIGGSGVVGSLLVSAMRSEGLRTYTLTRRGGPNRIDLRGDITSLATDLPCVPTVFTTVPITLLSAAVPALVRAGATRLITLSSSNVTTKKNDDARDSENALTTQCTAAGISWTMLRPTLIYREGHDRNITRIATLIRRFRAFPLYGQATGLRQPIHADDVVKAMVLAAATPATSNRIIEIGGGETLPYHEMVGRIFDALRLRRILLNVPPVAWDAMFSVASRFLPNISADMGERMMQDLVVDNREAQQSLRWTSRAFHPNFGP
jgi:nucleoside-diphosphate-sugar epimerase